ncbi:MAG: peptidoglycan-associated lipoprotein Pal [Xanthomonadales bacterium]|nr:peptidoglycan-associated lipoprotein Pal [Xanthomonadales bacterium]NIN59548.1 peptidoglycan-associated lipoprotein Pal [Xanthomonadales bacterium]NIN74914.1 peptidoglycan-associated lipoprotein Pal [Xanthomonadales bacterium]NIO14056.1 peptidoglycan-associated lipoprotein Pal [Xanthomonadales bacterium]NIP11941.1 peptidoglycan-associated lipoprotein Pal [Xanthomonadales bacterium]
MKIALRSLLALIVAIAVAACQTTEPEPEPVEQVTEEAPEVVTEAAPDPRDYSDPRNFDNAESLLSKRVIYFDFDKSDVKAEYRDIVAAHAAYMASHGSARVTLEGHADERGTREYNLGLGERRGNSVNGLLSAGGATGNQLNVVSYGEERPVCRVSDEDCWWQNRRVEIVYTAR